MNRILRIAGPTAKSTGSLAVVLACSLTLSACASPVAPAAKPANFYESVRSDVEGFWSDYFPAHRLGAYSPITKMQLYDTPVITGGCGETVLNNAEYCFGDKAVYLDSGLLQTKLSSFGDFASAVIIAHEIGHHIQDLLGLHQVFQIDNELQADCFAGSWIGSAGARGLLNPDDNQEAASSLFSLGDPAGFPWFNSQAHGTPQLRVQDFRIGLLNGAEHCFF